MTAKTVGMVIALLFGLVSGAVAADTGDTAKAIKEARDTIAAFRKADPSLSKFFKTAVGYAVFPTVTKGAIGIGGAGGRRLRGALREGQTDRQGVALPVHGRRPARGPNLLGDHLLRGSSGAE